MTRFLKPFVLLLFVCSLCCGCAEKTPDRELAKGIAALNQGELLAARRHLEKALALATEEVSATGIATPWAGMSEALNWLGMANQGLGLTNEAKRVFEESIQLDPQAFAPTYNLGVLLSDGGAMTDGIRFLTRAAEIDPTDIRATLRIGELTTRMGRWDLAKRMYFETQKRAPKSAEALVGLGRLAFLGDRTEEAEGYFMQALEIQPDYPAALYNLGVLYSRNPEQLEQSRAFLSRYLEQYPGSVRTDAAARRLGGENIEQSSFKLSSTPQPAPAAQEWMQVQKVLQAGDKATAYSHALRAIELAAGGNAKQEEEILRRALINFPDQPEVLLAAARFYVPQERLEEARDVLLRAQSLRPADSMVLFELARVSSLLGEYDATVLMLKQLLLQEPTNPDPLWELAELYADKLGMIQRGISTYLDFANQFPMDARTEEVDARVRQLRTLEAESGDNEDS